MSFFPEPAASDPTLDFEPAPPWAGPPEGELPVVLPVTGLIAVSHFAAVVLRTVRVYSNGVVLEIQGKLRRADASDEEWEDLQARFNEYGRRRQSSGGRLQVGVILADGVRVLAEPAGGTAEAAYRLTRTSGGGSGSERSAETGTDFWLWPLPPDGPLGVVIGWAAMDLPESRFEVDGSTFSADATRSEEIWPGSGGTPAGPQPSWTMSFSTAHSRADEQ